MSVTQQNHPFRRLLVSHIVEGGSRIAWELVDNFNEPGPYLFQLQFGRTGSNAATDWVDVGAQVVDGVYAVDDQKRLYGKTFETHYRVLLSTAVSRYLSQPVLAYGSLDEKDWLLAREIIRKEVLRHGRVSNDGYVLKRLRYGPRCTRCLDPQTGETQNSRCPQCYGTGFQGGYHPPIPFQWFDLKDGSPIQEKRGGDAPPGQGVQVIMRCRALAFPALGKEDVFVSGNSDERWIVASVEETASLRHVPLLYTVTLSCAPFTDVVYRFPVHPEQPPDPRMTQGLPLHGNGSVHVTHDYGGTDALSYQACGACGVEGATILAFTKASWDAGARTAAQAVASTQTTTLGRWVWALCLDPGDYVLLAEKPGEFDPDTMELTVAEPAPVDTPVFVAPAPPSEPPPLEAIIPRPPHGRSNVEFGIF